MRRHVGVDGFTLIEMLVVLIIIIIVIAIASPTISRLISISGLHSARETISAAVDVARARATHAHADLGAGGGVPGGTFSGSAAYFPAPSDTDEQEQIEILINDQRAKNNNGELRETNGNNAYRRIENVEPMDLPERVLVRGIGYDSGSSEIRLIEPPFAVTFNEHGNHVVRGDSQFYLTNSNGPITTVKGILLANRAIYEREGSDDDWLRENGRRMFFSTYTGVEVRSSQP